MRYFLDAFTSLVLNGLASFAQSPAKVQLKDMGTYFSGTWHGEGHFANGKPISATLVFTMPLDSAWIMASHTDELPNHYKAIAMWGVESGKLTATIFDNFGGHRLFEAQPWDSKAFVITKGIPRKDNSKAFERFTYQVIDRRHFIMKYELSADSLSWRLGD